VLEGFNVWVGLSGNEMDSVKIFFLTLSIASQLKNVIIPVHRYNHQKTLDLFSRMYNLLDVGVSKEVYLRDIDKYVNLYIKVVELLWFISPGVWHQITWVVVGIQQSTLKGIVKLAERYLVNYINFDPDLDTKINEHVHLYNLRVLESLLRRDFEVAVKGMEYQFTKDLEQAIFEAKGKSVPPVGNYLFYVDHTGTHKRKEN